MSLVVEQHIASVLSPAVLSALGPHESPMSLLVEALGAQQTRTFVESLSPLEALVMRYDWDLYARAAQRMPAGQWSTWVILGGRGMGKTRPGSETVIEWSKSLGRDYGGGKIALVAKDPGDARKVMIEGESGILASSPPWWRPVYKPSLKQLHWDNGVIADIYSSEEPDDLRGPQHHKAWGDELCKWKHPQETWDMLQFGMRLGVEPQTVLTTTPRPIKTLIEILSDVTTVVQKGKTSDNQANLSPAFLRHVYRKYKNTRLGRQELNAELLTDTPGALWTLDLIEATRVQKMPCNAVLIVVGVDPSANDGEQERDELDDELAETGIVAVAKGEDGHGYLLHDLSGSFSPAKWGARAVEHYEALKAEKIVGEVNNGGAMVEHVIKVAAKEAGYDVNFKSVHASRGKRTRAEPVAALYEQKRFHHVGAFPEVEDQMTTWVPGMKSPDRMDALVWAATEAMLLSPDELLFG